MNAFKVFSPTRPIGPVYLNTIPHIYIIALIDSINLLCETIDNNIYQEY